MNDLKRVVVLGHSGFIGSELSRRLRSNALEVVGLSLGEVDLTSQRASGMLEKYFTPETAVVMCSAIKRQQGDTRENFLKNAAMAANVAAVLEERPVGRFVYFSSTAVYGEDVHNESITELTPVCPTSYYGMAKHASERLLLKAVEKLSPSPLVLLRPPTIYGPAEPGRPYGPMGFLRAAQAGETVTLWGDGSEKREFVFINDAVEAVMRLLKSSFGGTLNLCSGASVSFQDILREISAIVPQPSVTRCPRTKAKADHVFDAALLRSVLPGLSFTPLPDGLRAAVDAGLETAAR